MEKFAYKIERFIQKTLFLYEKIYEVLLKEKIHIIDMNVDALWETISQKKSLAMSIEVIRQEAVCLFNQTYPGLEKDAAVLTFSYIVRIMNIPCEKKEELRKLILSIDTIKSDVKGLASDNSKFINDHLAVIDGIFSTLIDRPDKGNYSSFGNFLKQGGKNHLISAKV
ncbi:MAG: flagellar protein FlgN [Proteobacteria bacterium]|nr:flagellar protein FlgN [Pseudomonadota bacterium]MBU1388931.1 flagellar protein FlgN [Pseudomonadota bacterium]MBU1543483.1 flagellar protein FlgN [Pseudomonadota bacterium]MBU2430143.1 flagellar protein FlgN [Pseudomonadota bacterium]MBU2480225.1 flagellar protein FlgN [Pseudomonadota bacterium]